MSCAIYFFRRLFKSVFKVVAGIFNEYIERLFLQFIWALIWNFKNIFLKINKIKLFLSTLGMWNFYLLSYYFFSVFLGKEEVSWIDMFTMLFEHNNIRKSTFYILMCENRLPDVHPLFMILYMITPLFIMLTVSFFFEETDQKEKQDGCGNLFIHMDAKERLDFLENYFSGRNREYVFSYFQINQNISIIRDSSAGSNAATMLCFDDKNIFFRKYAFGEDSDKLYQQILWLKKYRNLLPLPKVLQQQYTSEYCYYDMPYNDSVVSFFEYIHSMPLEKSWDIMRRILERMEQTIYKMKVEKAGSEAINMYIESKIYRNLEKIKNAKRIKSLQRYKTIFINGVEYKNLEYYLPFLSERYLREIFKNDIYAVIHGDLTVENIMCMRMQGESDNFYLIDPNTGNIHNSPNLDYAKILQSIHGGYEFLGSIKHVNVKENRINFLYTKSLAYTELYERLKNYMVRNFDEIRIRSIYFHEIVHWLRLMPYKIKRDDKREIIFYAGLLMILDDVIKQYEKSV